jgi:hypothetical protein
MSVSCESCVLWSTHLCVGLIPSPEKSYRLWCIWVWSWSFDNEEALASWGLLRHRGKKTDLLLRQNYLIQGCIFIFRRKISAIGYNRHTFCKNKCNCMLISTGRIVATCRRDISLSLRTQQYLG